MAIYTKKKGDKIQARIKNKKLLPRPFYRTFNTVEEAKKFCEPIEAALKKGIVPASLKKLLSDAFPQSDIDSLAQAISAYSSGASPRPHDISTLATLRRSLGETRIRDVTRAWCIGQTRDWKVVDLLTPDTIRKRLGSLRRLFNWLVAERPDVTTVNPFTTLPENIASISGEERKLIEQSGASVQENVERDRPLEWSEEGAIRAVLAGTRKPDKERAPVLDDREELEMLLTLALESAMRLREMYTLTTDQVDIARKTIFLEKTKNGDARQVPLSSDAVAALTKYATSKGFVFHGQRRTIKKAGGALLFPLLFDGNWDRKNLARVTSKVSRRFGWLFEYAGVGDLTFHDTRHEATCRIYERTSLTDVQIARITGHKDLKMLRRYASLRGSDLAVQLW